eukprot:scaffold25384_cov129-Isochrysis_galbana.AAC.11
MFDGFRQRARPPRIACCGLGRVMNLGQRGAEQIGTLHDGARAGHHGRQRWQPRCCAQNPEPAGRLLWRLATDTQRQPRKAGRQLDVFPHAGRLAQFDVAQAQWNGTTRTAVVRAAIVVEDALTKGEPPAGPRLSAASPDTPGVPSFALEQPALNDGLFLGIGSSERLGWRRRASVAAVGLSRCLGGARHRALEVVEPQIDIVCECGGSKGVAVYHLGTVDHRLLDPLQQGRTACMDFVVASTLPRAVLLQFADKPFEHRREQPVGRQVRGKMRKLRQECLELVDALIIAKQSCECVTRGQKGCRVVSLPPDLQQ